MHLDTTNVKPQIRSGHITDWTEILAQQPYIKIFFEFLAIFHFKNLPSKHRKLPKISKYGKYRNKVVTSKKRKIERNETLGTLSEQLNTLIYIIQIYFQFNNIMYKKLDQNTTLNN